MTDCAKTAIIKTGDVQYLIKPYRCEKCNKTFRNKQNLKKHQRIHVVEKAYTCEECGKKFALHDYLKLHSLVHTQIKLHVCNQCEKKFTLSCNLIVHKRIHTGEKNFECNQCEKRFATKEGLKIHKLAIHDEIKNFECDQCNLKCSSKGNLTQHKRTHSGDKPYVCDQCENSFGHSSALKRHKRTHSGQKPFSCEICEKRFTTRDGVQKHKMFVHNTEKNFKCDECEAKFVDCSHLKRHKRHCHSDEKNYVCDQCGAKFKDNDVLKLHKRTHSNEKPYTCSHCAHSFNFCSNWRRHEKIHEIQSSYAIECIMQDFGTQPWTQDNGIKCVIRTKTQLDMEYHIQRNHTTEGLGRKLQSETRLAQFLTSKGQDFDRDWLNRISFKGCKNIEGGACSARPDAFLPSQSVRLRAIVLIGNDEFAHRQYQCDFQRVFNIANALEQTLEFKGVPLLYIRFNPHYYRKNDVYYDPPLNVSHEKLWELILNLSPEDIKSGINLIYVNYDTTNNQLDVFNQKDEVESNDFAKLYQSCVIKQI